MAQLQLQLQPVTVHVDLNRKFLEVKMLAKLMSSVYLRDLIESVL
jgi:hypothetical protein